MACGGGCGARGRGAWRGQGGVFLRTPALPVLSPGGVFEAHGGEVLGLGGAAEAEICEMESLCGAELPALTFLADKAPHLSP